MDWWGIAWLGVLLLINAFFVGAEFAVISARRSQIEPLAEAGSRAAKTALWSSSISIRSLATVRDCDGWSLIGALSIGIVLVTTGSFGMSSSSVTSPAVMMARRLTQMICVGSLLVMVRATPPVP